MSSEKRTIRIGTRGSPLAMVQTRTVVAQLEEAFLDLEVEIVEITTSGDWRPEQGEVALSADKGGKGQFAKEIEAALLAGEIDAAVHSMKDMDSHLPKGLVINHMLTREDVRDCLLFSNKIKGKADYDQFKNGGLVVLEEGAVVGTASVRRAAMMLNMRSDLKIEVIRGNVGTRIEKNRSGKYDCTLLAMAGLNRLGLADEADVILDVDTFLPAAGQGAVGIETREHDHDISAIFDRISDSNTVFCVKSERAALQVLDGACHSPIGAYAVIENCELYLRVNVLSLDGAQSFDDEIRREVGTIEDARALGAELAQRLKPRIPDGILQS